jgi:hypothetical protein
LINWLISVALAAMVTPALADTAATPAATASPTAAPTPVVSVDGLVDAYYTYNFTNSSKGVNGMGNNGTFFNTTDDAFSLALAEVDVKAVMGSATGFVALVGGSSNGSLALNPGIDFLQAYAAYTAGQFTLTGGRFSTWMGNEVIESNGNWNYSRSLLFWYTIPLWHQGISVAYTTPDSKFGITGYITNGWNNASTSGYYDVGKTYGLQLKFAPDANNTVLLNGIFGSNGAFAGSVANFDQGDSHYVAELVASTNVSDKFSLALDAEYGGISPSSEQLTTASFWGAALYGKYQISSDWSLALRLEELESSDSWLGIYGQQSASTNNPYVEGREATLTISHNLNSNLLFRLEGRYDYALTGGTADDPTATPAVPGPFAAGQGSQFTGSGSIVFNY